MNSRRLTRHLLLLALPAVVAVAAVGEWVLRANAGSSPADTTRPSSAGDTAPSAALLQRGEYVAKAADCAGCHTAPDGGAPYAGGLGMGSPFGTIVSSNITPDPRYGIGRYDLGDFERAIRHGIAPGGTPLYPAMPYPEFSKMSDEDLRALYAFLMHGVAPVAKPNAPSDVAFPFNQRWALRFWQAVFMPKPFRAHPDRDEQWNRGAYLVQSLGHCGACHTPRGFGYQERGYDESSPRYLTGGINDNWFAPNLTGEAGSGLGRLGEADIARFLKTGHAAGSIAYGSMVEQIEDSTQYMSDEDLQAIAHYLKSLPARQQSGSYDPDNQTAQAQTNGNRLRDPQSVGFNVYRSFCARCHGEDGKGIPNVFPALAGNPSVLAKDTTSLIRLLVEGGSSSATKSGPPRQRMPGFAGTLVDAQIGQVLTYVRSAWGNDAQPISGNDVNSLRQTLHK
ncbi:cytochrome c [Trinickia symbiotica]|uniref:Alcohol dehydrogenase n=1 Tax=Trinickia symbiotica TaxID=863227 RepID=A0A2N7X0J7_9BURK|nr:cytochrome c [Trinickia symbiotica]PMS35102.1 alcohol dehydrogenase [Trinickia symbiotica]